jgi:hypothetical protein
LLTGRIWVGTGKQKKHRIVVPYKRKSSVATTFSQSVSNSENQSKNYVCDYGSNTGNEPFKPILIMSEVYKFWMHDKGQIKS